MRTALAIHSSSFVTASSLGFADVGQSLNNSPFRRGAGGLLMFSQRQEARKTLKNTFCWQC